MAQKQALQLFNDQQIRTAWDEKEEKWYFSIVDGVAVLTDSVDPTAYWRKLKQRLKAEGDETVTNCHAFKMLAADSGDIAGNARIELDVQTGNPVISPKNAKDLLQQTIFSEEIEETNNHS